MGISLPTWEGKLKFAAILFASCICLTVQALAAEEAVRERPMRVPDVPAASFSPDQQHAAARIMEVIPNGRIPGPFRVLIRNPAFAEALANMVQAYAANARLERRINVLAVLVAARHFNAQYEWFANSRGAAAAGISADVVEAIRLGNVPHFTKSDEAAAYETVKALLEARSLSDAQYKRAVDSFGEDGLAELVTVAGMFSMIGMTVTTFGIEAPEPAPPHPLPVLDKKSLNTLH